MSRPTSSPEIPVTRFRPLKTNLFIVAFILVLCIIAMGFHPLFAFTLIFPILYTVWIFRVRTTLSPRGITAVYLFRGRRSVSWENFSGIFFDKGGRAFAVIKGDKKDRFALPAITFNSLPELNEVSGGRIPDPVTPARAAEDEKIEVFSRDGYSVMKKKETKKDETTQQND